MVLPVTINRHDGEEKLLAHTLDLTATSARLGGLAAGLEPGEIIEVQRGSAKGKFQVVWMGTPGGAMAGQAGIRSIEPERSIWSLDLPQDEIDTTVDAGHLRQAMPPVQASAEFPGERRWHPRHTCTGKVAIKTAGALFAINGETKDISKGGVYVELSAPLPVNSELTMDLYVEDIHFEAAGVVRTSYPLLGMGVCFQNLTPEDTEKLTVVVDRAKRKSAVHEQHTAVPNHIAAGPETNREGELPVAATDSDRNSTQTFLKLCRQLAQDFERWKPACTPAEIEEIKQALHDLDQKFSHDGAGGFIECLATPARSSKMV
jgi:hypothetical protein